MDNIISPRTHTPEMLETIYQKVSHEIEENYHNQAIMDQLALSSMIVLTSSVEQAIDLNSHQFFKKYWRILTGDETRNFETVAQHIRLLECIANHVLEDLKSKKLIKHHTFTFLSTSFQSISQIDSSRHKLEMTQFLKDVSVELEQDLPELQKEEFAKLLKEWQADVENKTLGETSFINLNSIEKITFFANEFIQLFNAKPSSKNIFDAISILNALKVSVNETVTYSSFFKEIIDNSLLFEKLLDGLLFKNAKRFYTPTLPLFKTIRKITLLKSSQQFIVNGIIKHLNSIDRGMSEEEVLSFLANSFLEECGYINPNSSVKLVDLFTELVVEMNILCLGNLSYDEYEEPEIEEAAVIIDAPFKLGQYVQFGNYEGKKITWIIIDIKEDSCTLLANENLFNTEFSKLKGTLGPGLREWNGSSIRKYLNSERGFLNEFSTDEHEKLLDTAIQYINDRYDYSENISRYLPPTKDTVMENCEDRVFLLSIKEVKELLFDQKISHANTESYFLRDSTFEQQIVLSVEAGGNINGVPLDDVQGIRPAIRIKRSVFGFGDGLLENPFRFVL